MRHNITASICSMIQIIGFIALFFYTKKNDTPETWLVVLLGVAAIAAIIKVFLKDKNESVPIGHAIDKTVLRVPAALAQIGAFILILMKY